jgi:hypothetical protein
MRWGGALAIAVWVAVVPAAGVPVHAADDEGGTPRIYRWIDENGVAHYTTDRDRIPAALRGRLGRGLAEPEPRREPPPPPSSTLAEEPPDEAAEPAREAAPATTPAPVPRNVETWAARDRRGGVADDAWSEGGLEPGAGAEPPPAEIAARRAEETERLGELHDRIAALEAEVAADEEALKRYISDPEAGGPLSRSGDPEFRAIAQRLPQRLAELRALREERAELATE